MFRGEYEQRYLFFTCSVYNQKTEIRCYHRHPEDYGDRQRYSPYILICNIDKFWNCSIFELILWKIGNLSNSKTSIQKTLFPYLFFPDNLDFSIYRFYWTDRSFYISSDRHSSSYFRNKKISLHGSSSISHNFTLSMITSRIIEVYPKTYIRNKS